jgi:hypothetical protein
LKKVSTRNSAACTGLRRGDHPQRRDHHDHGEKVEDEGLEFHVLDSWRLRALPLAVLGVLLAVCRDLGSYRSPTASSICLV